MGTLFGWWMGKPKAELEVMKAKRLAKIEKLTQEVTEIDKEINKQD